MELVLIEGIPGSGKSTLAKNLYQAARQNGVSAEWYLEEAKDHPVHPAEFKRERFSAPEHFGERCLKRWHGFLSEHKEKTDLYILEGSVFQSTLRFMLEADREDQARDYFAKYSALITDHSPVLYYLRPGDLVKHLDWIMERRGDEWTDKVGLYLANTPYCSRRGWGASVCMKNFWSDYALLCDSLIAKTGVRTYTLPQRALPPL